MVMFRSRTQINGTNVTYCVFFSWWKEDVPIMLSPVTLLGKASLTLKAQNQRERKLYSAHRKPR